jgi:hypothetical protein
MVNTWCQKRSCCHIGISLSKILEADTHLAECQANKIIMQCIQKQSHIMHIAQCTLHASSSFFCSQFFICLIANVQLPSSCLGTTRNVRSLETVTLSTTKLFHISHYHYPQKSAYELVNITLSFRFTGQASSGSLCFSATSLSSRRDIAGPNRELICWSTPIMATSLFLPKDDG